MVLTEQLQYIGSNCCTQQALYKFYDYVQEEPICTHSKNGALRIIFSLLIKTDANYVYDRHESDLFEMASYAKINNDSDVSKKKNSHG